MWRYFSCVWVIDALLHPAAGSCFLHNIFWICDFFLFLSCTKTFIQQKFYVMMFSCYIFSKGIEKIAWDASGERLALSYKDGEELYKGLIAIYDVRRTPLISASLVWVIIL